MIQTAVLTADAGQRPQQCLSELHANISSQPSSHYTSDLQAVEASAHSCVFHRCSSRCAIKSGAPGASPRVQERRSEAGCLRTERFAGVALSDFLSTYITCGLPVAVDPPVRLSLLTRHRLHIADKISHYTKATLSTSVFFICVLASD